MIAIPYLACMIATARYYHLPPRVLPAIHRVEGGAVGTVHRNTDGSDDFGVMQINTRWIEPLARFARMQEVAVRARLIGDACFNIAAAGAILRTYLDAERGDLMRAIGDYHSHTPALNLSYQAEVLGAAWTMFGNATASRR